MVDGLPLILAIYVLVLAMLAGFEVISKVPPILHTPLMSGSNAVSGITVIGALVLGGGESSTLVAVLGFIAIVQASINVVGGFMVTDRMLQMFRRKPEKGSE